MHAQGALVHEYQAEQLKDPGQEEQAQQWQESLPGQVAIQAATKIVTSMADREAQDFHETEHN